MAEIELSARAPGALPSHGLFSELACEKPKERLLGIDAARGLAILLVVIGHVVARDMPAGNEWYAQLKDTIYLFHMPLFMVLTGMTFALSLPRFAVWAETARFSMKRVERLFVPYVAFGVAIIAGKIIASRFVVVDNPPGESALLALLVRPTESGATFLWFIYVLSIYLLLVPAFFQLAGRRPMLLLLAGVALNFVGPWTPLFMLDSVVAYLPFFAAGMVLWMQRDAWKDMRPCVLWASTILFVALLLMAQFTELSKWLVGAASVLPVLGWMQRLPAGPLGRLAALGRASLAIYLMNTIAIGVTKGLMLKLLPWDGINFLLYFPLLALAGVALPLLARDLAARYTPRLARYVA
jgi:fucose 4-O-acetylase-like acetyltransferase